MNTTLKINRKTKSFDIYSGVDFISSIKIKVLSKDEIKIFIQAIHTQDN